MAPIPALPSFHLAVFPEQDKRGGNLLCVSHGQRDCKQAACTILPCPALLLGGCSLLLPATR